MSHTHPILIIVRGIPGSGKSHLTSRMADTIGHDNVVVLDPDTIDKTSNEYIQFSAQLTNEGVDEKFHPFRFLRQRGFDAIINNQIIIWNQAFIDLKGFQITIDRLVDFAKERDIDLPLLVVEVEIEASVARARITDRHNNGGHDVPSDKFEEFVNSYESFSKHGFATVTVDGAGNIDESVQKLLDIDIFKPN